MARELVIANRRIADDTPPLVVAEIGHSHNGSVALAEHMVTMAFLAGADAVKFQSRVCHDIYTDELYNRPFVSEHAAAPQRSLLGYDNSTPELKRESRRVYQARQERYQRYQDLMKGDGDQEAVDAFMDALGL